MANAIRKLFGLFGVAEDSVQATPAQRKFVEQWLEETYATVAKKHPRHVVFTVPLPDPHEGPGFTGQVLIQEIMRQAPSGHRTNKLSFAGLDGTYWVSFVRER